MKRLIYIIILFIISISLFCLYKYTKNNTSKNKATISKITKPKDKASVSTDTTQPTNIIENNPLITSKETLNVPDNIIDKIKNSTPTYNKQDIRKFPYPYNSMVSICSDIDDTTLEEFEEYHQFLNTTETTPHGKGLGLDIGDSMWMFLGSDFTGFTDSKGSGQDKTMTYFYRTDNKKINNSDKIINYYKCGWLDSLHTYGDFTRSDITDISFKRQYAIDAFNELTAKNMKFKVWINHGNEANKQNFGGYNPNSVLKCQEGDNPNSPYYNSDLVVQNGIKFLWNSQGETAFGQSNPLFTINLRDGKSIWGFHRYTNDPNNPQDWTHWEPANIHKQITKERLDNLSQNQQYSIVTQHLGKSIPDLFKNENIEALRLLEQYYRKKEILVARTSRLLNYALCQNYVRYSLIKDNDTTWINIQSIADPNFGEYEPTFDDIRGLTFYTDNPDNTHILLNCNPINSNYISKNDVDVSSKKSISVKWFNEDTKDHSKDSLQ